MIEFFKRLFAPEHSGATAKERLRLVLLSDHLSLAPDVVESLRADLIAVISKYVEVDEANCDVSFEQQDRAVAVLANIPILAMRERTPPAGGAPPPAPPRPPSSSSSPPPRSDPPPREDALGAAYAVADSADDAHAAEVAALLPAVPSGPAPRKRRRRRRASNSTAAAPG